MWKADCDAISETAKTQYSLIAASSESHCTEFSAAYFQLCAYRISVWVFIKKEVP